MRNRFTEQEILKSQTLCFPLNSQNPDSFQDSVTPISYSSLVFNEIQLGARRTEDKDPPTTAEAAGAQLAAMAAWEKSGGEPYADLKKITQPVLVINGNNDIMIPTVNSFTLSAHLADAQLIIYPDSGHGACFSTLAHIPVMCPSSSTASDARKEDRLMTGLATGSTPLKWEILVTKRLGITRDLPPGKEQWMWVPTSATLIYGKRDAVLVDAFLTVGQANALVEWVAATGKNLTTIYVTHGHGDHFFGIGAVLDRFPNARAVARPML
jgi:Metallo-beta-lactamase superfamily/TAP-like protein